MAPDILLLGIALALAMWLRPWRQLVGGALLTPLLACLTLLPWLWALPRLHDMPLHLQLSGACAVVLMLGWPLAIGVFVVVTLLSGVIAPADVLELTGQAVWEGVVPATLAVAFGALLRWLTGTHPFIYILGRAFIGTALCTFAAGSLSQLVGHEPAHVSASLGLVARWLLAWGDAFMTGMLAAIFVAFKPQWLATWSDTLYLKIGENHSDD